MRKMIIFASISIMIFFWRQSSPFSLIAQHEFALDSISELCLPLVSGSICRNAVLGAENDDRDIYLPVIAHPNIITRPHPPHNAQEQSSNVWLAWDVEAGAEATQPITFVVSGWLQSPGERDLVPFESDALAATAWDPPTFQPGGRVVWRVTATDAAGRTFTSPEWQFTVEAATDVTDLSAMADVPAGYFYQGCDVSLARAHPCFDKEFPLRQVWLDGFAIDKYEVTNGEYLACVNAGACSIPIQTNSNKRADYFGNPEFADYPVLYVSHWDAEAFCAWEGKRLPTEAEWEKAARGPMDTREWPWGSEYPTCDRINFGDDRDPDAPVPCLDDTDRVGARPLGASPYGVMDMSGNAFEWVHDLYNVYYYDYAPNVNPPGPDYAHTDRAQGPDEIPYFTIRGGSYRAHWFYPRVTHRHWGHKGPLATSYDDVPYFRNNFVGFRCARALP